MLRVAYHWDRYVAYEHSSLDRIFLVFVEFDKLFAYIVGIPRSVFDDDRFESVLLDGSGVCVYFLCGMAVAIGIDYDSESAVSGE